ncbi:MAG TPA: alpha/beta hydrolase [Solirubrobacteraceae bacterium]|jgi:pimeloyl-ACP methyl ester carboxylesterase|nr:alpha/beta hydrolase [Solirubrobacteraceae bacterium]
MLPAVAVEQQRTMQIDGRRFAWRALGEGPPLLLLNGYAGTAADWDPTLLAALARSFSLICPDNRGMGGSELGDAAELSIDAMAADCERLLQELELDRTALVGWSMGGYVAQRLVLRAPEPISAMVLLATAPGGPAAVPAAPGIFARLTDYSGTPREQATRLLSLLFPRDVAAEIDREFGDLVAAARARLSPRALDAQARALAAWHAEPPQLPGADSPRVLALCGDRDIVIPPENSELLAAFWPGARAERIAGGGHAFMAQEPECVAALIVEFLSARQVEARAGASIERR